MGETYGHAVRGLDARFAFVLLVVSVCHTLLIAAVCGIDASCSMFTSNEVVVLLLACSWVWIYSRS